jgi:hypothetical protein
MANAEASVDLTGLAHRTMPFTRLPGPEGGRHISRSLQTQAVFYPQAKGA